MADVYILCVYVHHHVLKASHLLWKGQPWQEYILWGSKTTSCSPQVPPFCFEEASHDWCVQVDIGASGGRGWTYYGQCVHIVSMPTPMSLRPRICLEKAKHDRCTYYGSKPTPCSPQVLPFHFAEDSHDQCVHSMGPHVLLEACHFALKRASKMQFTGKLEAENLSW